MPGGKRSRSMAKKFIVTRQQLKDLANSILSVPDRPQGECLETIELFDYVDQTLPSDEVARFDAHLQSCPSCCDRLEKLFAAADAVGNQGAQRALAVIGQGLASALHA